MVDEPGFSVNERAEGVMGRRRTDVVFFDMPCELGYRCPVHDEPWDEGLAWSEYNGFLWCERCDFDYPSCFCVPSELRDEDRRFWTKEGVAGAVEIFLDTVESAKARALVEWESNRG